jgi:outer membrane protein assembly factor BamB
MAKRFLGWLGPIIVLVGAAIAGVAVWYTIRARPTAGEVIDTIAIGPQAKVVVRHEVGGKNAFLELHENGKLVWQAYIPRYAGAPGRPAIAWSDRAITVRVDRDGGRAEVFAFSRANASKLGALRLAQVKEPIHIHAQGPITLTDHVRSYELIGGADWQQLIAIDLATGEGLWKADLGKDPIAAGGIEAGRVWLEQAGKRRTFDVATGREQSANPP